MVSRQSSRPSCLKPWPFSSLVLFRWERRASLSLFIKRTRAASYFYSDYIVPVRLYSFFFPNQRSQSYYSLTDIRTKWTLCVTSPIVGAYNAGTSHDSQSTVVADNLAIFFFCMERNIYIYTFCYARPPRNEQRRKRTQNGMTAKACYKASGERVFFFLLLKIYKFCCLRARSSTPPVPSQKKPTVLQSIRRDCRYHRSNKRNYNLYIVIIL